MRQKYTIFAGPARQARRAVDHWKEFAALIPTAAFGRARAIAPAVSIVAVRQRFSVRSRRVLPSSVSR